jgi:hypothetical protein
MVIVCGGKMGDTGKRAGVTGPCIAECDLEKLGLYCGKVESPLDL